ncbi:hypothetical protein BGZ65_012530 [Modicella reniformis]|uniref:Uncharacterized protein n=1 Tax=Modicella reniformis TaxID=1440133 RepID=A0A9P6IQ62_9FUNG|nr:hypothetical protein BGZ65_012530 [Modicella reniformis]
MDKLQDLLRDGKHAKKPLHISIKKSLKMAFHLQYADRIALGENLAERGWNVKVGSVEADVDIARECGPDDVVLTKDSDALVYKNITTTYARSIVKAYCQNPAVMLKNQHQAVFSTSLRVFVDMDESPLPPSESTTDTALLLTRYNNLCERHRELAQERQQQRDQRRWRRLSNENEPPATMKQYMWKPHRQQGDTKPEPKQVPPSRKKKPKAQKKNIGDMTKWELVQEMDKEHSTVTLDVGMLKANARRTAGDDSGLADEVVHITNDAARLAGETMKRLRLLKGSFMQMIVDKQGQLSQKDKEILHAICPPLSKPGSGSNQKEDDDDESEDKTSVKYKQQP